MSYKINQKEIESICALENSARYAHFIKRVSDWQEIWGLRSSEGWISVGNENDIPAFAVWPHSEYAKLQAQGDWTGCVPESIVLDLFLKEWLPKMQSQSVPIAIFPVKNLKAIVVTASQLITDLTKEINQYE